MVDAKNKETRTLRDIMRVVFRRKFQFFGAASFFALAVLIGSHWIGLKYTGTTKFTLYSDPAAKTVQSPGNESLDAAKETLRPWKRSSGIWALKRACRTTPRAN